MGVFQRIQDIIAANWNDLIEKYEDPEQMLRQAVREMEEAISAAKPDVAKAMANEKTTARELENNLREVEVWSERAATAVDNNDDDLARRAIARKQEYAKIVAALRDQHHAALDAVATLRRQLEGMQAKLAEAKRRLGTLSARKKAADARAKIAQANLSIELDKDAFAKFDRLTRKVEQAEAEAEAFAELARDERGGRDEAEPATESGPAELAIEAELAVMKNKVRRGI